MGKEQATRGAAPPSPPAARCWSGFALPTLRHLEMSNGLHRAPAAEYLQPRAMAATSSTLYFRCTLLSDVSCFRHAHAGPPLGHGTDPPLKAAVLLGERFTWGGFGHTLCSLLSTHPPERAFIGTDPLIDRVGGRSCLNIRSSAGVARHGVLAIVILRISANWPGGAKR